MGPMYPEVDLSKVGETYRPNLSHSKYVLHNTVISFKMMVVVLKEIFKDQWCLKRQTNKQMNKQTDTFSKGKDFSFKYDCFKVV